MDNKKPLIFVFRIVAIILGWALYKQFNFEQLQFKNTGLATIYFITFVFSIYFLVKNSKKGREQED